MKALDVTKSASYMISYPLILALPGIIWRAGFRLASHPKPNDNRQVPFNSGTGIGVPLESRELQRKHIALSSHAIALPFDGRPWRESLRRRRFRDSGNANPAMCLPPRLASGMVMMYIALEVCHEPYAATTAARPHSLPHPDAEFAAFLRQVSLPLGRLHVGLHNLQQALGQSRSRRPMRWQQLLNLCRQLQARLEQVEADLNGGLQPLCRSCWACWAIIVASRFPPKMFTVFVANPPAIAPRQRRALFALANRQPRRGPGCLVLTSRWPVQRSGCICRQCP
jgi:hypothetical protein